MIAHAIVGFMYEEQTSTHVKNQNNKQIILIICYIYTEHVSLLLNTSLRPITPLGKQTDFSEIWMGSKLVK